MLKAGESITIPTPDGDAVLSIHEYRASYVLRHTDALDAFDVVAITFTNVYEQRAALKLVRASAIVARDQVESNYRGTVRVLDDGKKYMWTVSRGRWIEIPSILKATE